MFFKKRKTITETDGYRSEILKAKLKTDVINKLNQIRMHIDKEDNCSYGASYEQNLRIILEDLDDILLNWKD
jgi:hypothetical protein